MLVASVTFAGNDRPMKRIWTLAAAVGSGLWWAGGIAANVTTPVGLWKTVDDKTGEARSHVRIVERNGILTGRIEDILDAGKRDARCIKCDGPHKDQPVRGMVIIEGVRANAKNGYWDSGTILDPNDGKVYKLRLTPQSGGAQLEVRGFVGPFYRNQHWIRLE